MADSLGFNKIAAGVLATGLVIFGLQNLISEGFKRAPPEHPGYAIAVQEDTGGADAVQPPPDWGTVLPKADIAHGQSVTQKCVSCHSFDASGANGPQAPGLYGVVGRAPGSHPGFAYSSAMADFAKTHPAWTYDELDQWLKAPGQFMPGTKMGFAGLSEQQDRIDVIAYLRSNGSPSFPIPAPKPATPAAGPTNAINPTNATSTQPPTNAASTTSATGAVNSTAAAPQSPANTTGK